MSNTATATVGSLVKGEIITTRDGSHEIVRATYLNDDGLRVIQLADGRDEVHDPDDTVTVHRPAATALARWA